MVIVDSVEFWWITYGKMTDPEPASIYFHNGKPNEAFIIGHDGPITEFELRKKVEKYD